MSSGNIDESKKERELFSDKYKEVKDSDEASKYLAYQST